MRRRFRPAPPMRRASNRRSALPCVPLMALASWRRSASSWGPAGIKGAVPSKKALSERRADGDAGALPARCPTPPRAHRRRAELATRCRRRPATRHTRSARMGSVREHMPGRLRPRANDECRLFMIDRSRANTPRRCSMRICGNRIKGPPPLPPHPARRLTRPSTPHGPAAGSDALPLRYSKTGPHGPEQSGHPMIPDDLRYSDDHEWVRSTNPTRCGSPSPTAPKTSSATCGVPKVGQRL
jgi:hypothetical protein